MSLKDAHAPIIGGVKRSVTPSAGYDFFLFFVPTGQPVTPGLTIAANLYLVWTK